MAVFACAAKLGSGPTARGTLGLIKPTVRYAVVISRQRNSSYKAEQVKYRGTRPGAAPRF